MLKTEQGNKEDQRNKITNFKPESPWDFLVIRLVAQRRMCSKFNDGKMCSPLGFFVPALTDRIPYWAAISGTQFEKDYKDDLLFMESLEANYKQIKFDDLLGTLREIYMRHKKDNRIFIWVPAEQDNGNFSSIQRAFELGKLEITPEGYVENEVKND